jgi:hypothetical protein
MDRLSRMLAHAQASTPAPAEYNTPISDDAPISPLVARSKIEAQFNREKQLTQQTCHSSRQGYRGVREEQHWQREEQLGCGSFGYVYLEKCTLGSSMGQVRAVKEIRKRKGIDYLRELEAVATFSCPQVRDERISRSKNVCLADSIAPSSNIASSSLSAGMKTIWRSSFLWNTSLSEICLTTFRILLHRCWNTKPYRFYLKYSRA